nr:phosrestin-2-like [Cherax quadricarinatus]
MVWLEDGYVKDRRVFAQVVMTYRYGREEDEVMGLTFARELVVASTQVYPPTSLSASLTSLQERLQKKLGINAFPFHLEMPRNAPASVTIQQGQEESGRACGVHWQVRVFVGSTQDEQPHRRSCVRLLVRRRQYAPAKQGRQPMVSCTKEFLLSPGKLHLNVILDRQIYYHGEAVNVQVNVINNCNKQVKKVQVCVVQVCDVALGTTADIRNTIATIQSQEGCPVVPGFSLGRTYHLCLHPQGKHQRRGLALEGQLKVEETSLASSTLFTHPGGGQHFGIVVSYVVRVKLVMGTLAGELVAEVPFTLMNPPPDDSLAAPVREGRQENLEERARLVIEECQRTSISDMLRGGQESQESVDNTLPDTTDGYQIFSTEEPRQPTRNGDMK